MVTTVLRGYYGTAAHRQDVTKRQRIFHLPLTAVQHTASRMTPVKFILETDMKMEKWVSSRISLGSGAAECHRDSCKLRCTDLKGKTACLMESVRNKWKIPQAVNYCQDPAARKFVEHIHTIPADHFTLPPLNESPACGS